MAYPILEILAIDNGTPPFKRWQLRMKNAGGHGEWYVHEDAVNRWRRSCEIFARQAGMWLKTENDVRESPVRPWENIVDALSAMRRGDLKALEEAVK